METKEQSQWGEKSCYVDQAYSTTGSVLKNAMNNRPDKLGSHLSPGSSYFTRATLMNRKMFTVVPEHQKAGKPLVFPRASDRHHINQIKLFEPIKKVESLGLKGTLSNRTQGKIGLHDSISMRTKGSVLDTATNAKNLISSIRQSKAGQTNIPDVVSSMTEKQAAINSGMSRRDNSNNSNERKSPITENLQEPSVFNGSIGSSALPSGTKDYVRVYNAGNGG